MGRGGLWRLWLHWCSEPVDENAFLGAGFFRSWRSRRAVYTRLLATADEHEADLTFSDFDWKAVLKSLPTGANIVQADGKTFQFCRTATHFDKSWMDICGHVDRC